MKKFLKSLCAIIVIIIVISLILFVIDYTRVKKIKIQYFIKVLLIIIIWKMKSLELET